MINLALWQFIIIGIGAFLAGVTNALAGGGTLITFPLLTAMGIPPVIANVTNTAALCPGYFGGILAQRRDLAGQKKRLFIMVPAAILGGVIGGYLLLHTGEKLFSQLVPYLILMASALLALGGPVRTWLMTQMEKRGSSKSLEAVTFPAILVTALYGGYFGAGMSVINLAVLGILVNDTLTRLNAVKQVLALATNLAAAIFFLFSGKVYWIVALVMAVCALGGGAAGGRLAGKVNPNVLRWLVVSIGVVVAVIYFIK
jgi:uncharacterized protein